MIKRAKKPALCVPATRYGKFVAALMRAGYQVHKGLSLQHRDELEAYVKEYVDGGRVKQIHVQVAAVPGKTLRVYAHTETSLRKPLEHLLDAITGKYDYVEGAEILKRDLARAGWK